MLKNAGLSFTFWNSSSIISEQLSNNKELISLLKNYSISKKKTELWWLNSYTSVLYFRQKGNKRPNFSNMFKCKNYMQIYEFTVKSFDFLINFTTIKYIFLYLLNVTKIQGTSDFRWLTYKFCKNTLSTNVSQTPSCFSTLCLLSHLLQNIKATMGTSTTWLCPTNPEIKQEDRVAVKWVFRHIGLKMSESNLTITTRQNQIVYFYTAIFIYIQ